MNLPSAIVTRRRAPAAGAISALLLLLAPAPGCVLVAVDRSALRGGNDRDLEAAPAGDENHDPRGDRPRSGAPEPDDAGPAFTMRPIGKVVNREGRPVQLRIDPAFAAGLKGLDGWSHVQVFYWFDRNDNPVQRRILQVHPRGDRRNPLTGVFACRAPVRPNLIALSTARILGVEGGVVTIDGIDAFDGTPILDLKPYSPGVDRAGGEVQVPAWARRGRREGG